MSDPSMELATQEPSLGVLLRLRRQDAGLSLDAVAQRTRIRRVYLEALEADDYAALPGEAYVCGFLRVYAGVVGLDAEEALGRYRQQIDPSGEAPAEEAEAVGQPEPVALPGRRLHRGWLFTGLAAVAAVLMVLVVLPMRQQEAGVAGQVPDVATPEFQENQASLSASEPPESPAGAQVPAGQVAEMRAPDEPAKPTAPSVAEGGLELPPGGGVVRIQALGPVHLEVTADGRALRTYDLGEGAVLSWKVRRQIRLEVDTPLAVQAWVDRKPIGFSGRTTLILNAPPTGDEE